MPEPLITVVIPTRNRKEILQATLEALDRQTGILGPWEVVVADDGSSDGTSGYLGSVGGPLSFHLEWLTLAPAGPAVARNRAIAKASRAAFSFRETTRCPTRRRVPSLAPAVGPGAHRGTPSRRSPRDAFSPRGLRLLRSPRRLIPYTALYASNISAPKERFRERSTRNSRRGIRDTELAYRWHRRGYPVLYRESDLQASPPYESIEPSPRGSYGRDGLPGTRSGAIPAWRPERWSSLPRRLLGAAWHAGLPALRQPSESAHDPKPGPRFRGFFLKRLRRLIRGRDGLRHHPGARRPACATSWRPSSRSSRTPRSSWPTTAHGRLPPLAGA
jgi:hypothetical protein